VKKNTIKTKEIIKASFNEALHRGSNKINPEHILLSILSDNDNSVVDVLLSMGVDVEDLISRIESTLRSDVKNPNMAKKILVFSETAKKIVNGLDLQATKMGDGQIDPEHILLSILSNRTLTITKIMSTLGITYKTFKETLLTIKKEISMSITGDFDEIENQKQTKSKSKTGTPVLDNFSRDLTKLAESNLLDPVVGRVDEVDRVVQILSRRKKNNPLLIGEAGAGKTSVAEGLAIKIHQKDCPRNLFDKRVVALDLASLVAGTKFRGQFEERMKGIIQELEKNNNVILFIDEIHTMVGAGNASGSLDASNILKPALARGEIQCIGATTLDEFREHIEKDAALTRRFQTVLIEPTNEKDTIQILMNIKDRYEQHHKVTYTPESIELCVKLSEKYITDRAQPDKSIDIMDEVGARSQMKTEVPQHIKELEKAISDIDSQKKEVVRSQRFEDAAKLRDQERELESKLEQEMKLWKNGLDKHRKTITEDDVAKVVAMITGIPVTKVSKNEVEKLNTMETELKSKVIGQDHAIEQTVKAIKRNRMGIKKKDKIIGGFLYLGSTGTGKTHLAKKIAEEVFGSEEHMFRIDMSEYMEKHSVSKLIGSPPGYVGHEDGGQLTERVRRKPYCVILLDEIEKAHPDVFNILLQVLDEGHLTDSMGRKVNFKNTLIIMTSNVGARKLQDFGTGVGFGTRAKIEKLDELKNSVIEDSVKKTFSPEFLNRLDDIIIFKPLNKEDIKRVVDIPIKDLTNRMIELGYNLKITPTMKNYLCEVGYDEKYGARPLNRAIQKYIEDPIAEKLLEGGVNIGDTIKIGYSKNKVVIDIDKNGK
jgi:ATP-dependent Clp protease ATP-binding subunit ClpC